MTSTEQERVRERVADHRMQDRADGRRPGTGEQREDGAGRPVLPDDAVLHRARVAVRAGQQVVGEETERGPGLAARSQALRHAPRRRIARRLTRASPAGRPAG
ncbi:hypothetical protein JCM9534A_18120 [Catenuloplanes indicus JCM 9534]